MTFHTPKKKVVKAYAIVHDEKLGQQWHSAKGCFLYRVYVTAETARNQLRKMPPECDAWVVPVIVSLPTPPKKKAPINQLKRKV